jgi:hypothetical protein
VAVEEDLGLNPLRVAFIAPVSRITAQNEPFDAAWPVILVEDAPGEKGPRRTVST